MEFLFNTLFVCTSIGLPVLLVVGWVRWARCSQPRTVPAILSLAGFTLATTSALLGIGALLYSFAIGGFPFYDPRLLRIYRYGFFLSLFAVVFGVGGVWRTGPLRWHSVLCGAGTLVFWFLAAVGE